MYGELLDQFLNSVPPTRGQGFTQTVDNTVRVYDLSGLAWGGTGFRQGAIEQCLYLTLHNDTASTVSIYFRFQEDNTADMDPTATIAAGTTPTLTTTLCQELAPGAFWPVRIDRILHRYLSVATKTSSATLTVSMSSQENH